MCLACAYPSRREFWSPSAPSPGVCVKRRAPAVQGLGILDQRCYREPFRTGFVTWAS